ncbi:retrovirus-related Pol polyprotein from type-1 retrotransposable element R1 [Trichonephila clavipes]|nr:retrovirus-related Pol polyprotein from type-1 retrotransposable element R1 [Trichonephila clavipes]
MPPLEFAAPGESGLSGPRAAPVNWFAVNSTGWRKLDTTGLSVRCIATGETTTSLDETINAVLQKSFPSDSEEKDNIFQKNYRHAARTAYPSFFDPSFSYDEVNTMVSMLKLNKSPGPDSISNEIIKQFHLAFPSFLHKLFNVCLGLGIFPRIWKLAQVILIPKVNEFRVPHLNNLRCIILLPALGKCLEKLFVNRISWYLRRGDFLSSDQYGFTPHKSTEDALLRLNEIVKRGKRKHLHSILISLDIKGAFDNAWWPCILNLLKKAEIPINIFSLVADFLNDRVVKMQLGSTSAIRCLERGCLQGSVSGPIFWNIIINDLLSKLKNLACCEIIAFADDILVCSQCRDLSETFLHAQEALNFASDWSKSFKLEFNPDKTRFMAIEKRNVCYDAFQLYLDGTPLTMENLSASSISNYDCILSPFFIPHPSERNAINIVQFSDKSTEDFPVICYTDGSKIDGRVGFAFVVFRSGVESENFQFRIRDECTVL